MSSSSFYALQVVFCVTLHLSDSRFRDQFRGEKTLLKVVGRRVLYTRCSNFHIFFSFRLNIYLDFIRKPPVLSFEQVLEKAPIYLSILLLKS